MGIDLETVIESAEKFRENLEYYYICKSAKEKPLLDNLDELIAALKGLR